MYLRCAFFEGRVKPGHEAAFTTFVQQRLVPLWTKFPGAEDVRVLRQSQAGVDEPFYEMVLAIRYPSLEAIALDEAACRNDPGGEIAVAAEMALGPRRQEDR